MMIKMISFFLSLILMASSPYPGARSGPLLSCLAREEEEIHKDRRGDAIAHLNQFFIHKLSTLGKMPLTPTALAKICGPKISSPSLRLLHELIFSGKDIFSQDKPVEEKFFSLIPLAFFGFVAKVQEDAPTPDCLQREIPQLTRLYQRYKHLEQRYTYKFLWGERNQLKTIWYKLEKVDAIFKKCTSKK